MKGETEGENLCREEGKMKNEKHRKRERVKVYSNMTLMRNCYFEFVLYLFMSSLQTFINVKYNGKKTDRILSFIISAKI